MLLPCEQVISEDLDYIVSKARSELEKMAGQHVWFTGGAGFLGYYFTKAVDRWNATSPARSAIRLTILDNFVRGTPPWLGQVDSPCIGAMRHDVTTPLPPGLSAPHFIVHGASIASPTYYRRHPLETIDANVNGLRLMLNAAREQGEQTRMLFFSTSEIYGDPTPADIPTSETFRGIVSCTGPRACYDESKRLGETLCVTYAQQFGLQVAIARPFNNYGPGLKLTDGRVLPDFARDALQGRDIEMRSDGTPTRTFCYVADAVVGYLKVLTAGRPGEPYNIGIESPEISMAELAELVARHSRELWGYGGSVSYRPSAEAAYLIDNPNRRCPSIAKARNELGYAPEIGVEDGLRRTLNWYYFNRAGEAN